MRRVVELWLPDEQRISGEEMVGFRVKYMGFNCDLVVIQW